MGLSIQQMEDVIKGGGSVLVTVGGKKRLVSKLENLPSKAALAVSEQDKQAAAADLDKQIADLQRERDGLVDGGKTASQSEKSETAETKLKAENAGDGLPEDFPARHIFDELGFKTAEEVQSKTRDELIALKGIGEKSADAALDYGK